MQITQRARLLIIAVVALVAAIGAVRLALPAAIRWLAAGQLTALTGLTTTIGEVDVSVLARRVVVHDVVVGAADGEPRLASIPRVDVALRLPPLLRGRVALERLAIEAPELGIVRFESGTTNLDTLVAALSSDDEGRLVALESFVIDNGAVVFHDRAVDPERTWRASHVDVRLQGVDAQDPAGGTGSATLVLAGAPTGVVLKELGLQPTRGRATVTTEGLALGPVWAYVPEEAGGRPRGGELAGEVHVAFGADGLRAQGTSTVTDVAWVLEGEAAPLVVEDRVTMRFDELAIGEGVVRVGRLEVASDPTLTDPTVEPPRRFTFDPLRLVAENLVYPVSEPGRVSVLVGAPEGGRLVAQGTLQIEPLAVDIEVDAREISLALAQPYLPSDAPVGIAQGRLRATLDVALGEDALRVDGVFGTTRTILTREGQDPPFVSHPRLEGRVAGLVWRPDDGVTVERLSVTGAPTVVDGGASPPARLQFSTLSLVAEALAWPAPTPARVRLTAELAAGGRATARGTFTPATLATDLRARFEAAGVELVGAYLPPGAGVTLVDGAAQGELRLQHTPDGRTRLAGSTTVTDLTLAVGADARRITVPVVRAAVDDLAWPAAGPLRLETSAELPGAGRLEASGTVALDSGRLDAAVQADDAALGSYAGLLPIDAPVRGTVDLALEVTGSLGEPLELVATGRASAEELALGEPDTAAVTVARVELDGVTVRWPLAASVEQATVTGPSVLVLRAEDGSFPLRAMLTPADRGNGPAEAGDDEIPPIRVGQLRIEEGDARFVDRTVTPAYSEELTSVVLTLEHLDSTTDDPAALSMQAVVGADAALELEGPVAPFADPFLVELQGELRGFALPRTNPYVTHFLDWIVERGTLTTEVRYRIVGDQLNATNELLVQQLRVERQPPAVDSDRGLGIPLGLVTAILADHRGDIRVTIPVSGELGSPRFSFTDALGTAFRRLVAKAVTGPFQAIGRIIRGRPGGLPQDLAIEPLEFSAGVAALPEEGRQHLQRVADFLRAAPQIELRLRSIASAADVQALRRQAALAAIQQVQRKEAGDFETAATRVFERRYPGRPVPESVEGVVAALSEDAGPVDPAARELATRRLRTVRQLLMDEAGIQSARLRVSDARVPPGVPGAPRVEFDFAAQARSGAPAPASRSRS